MTPAAARLTALVRECAAAGVGRKVLLLRADRLPPALARPHHLRLAEAALTPLLRADRAQVFRLPERRIAVVWRGDAEEAILKVAAAIQTLLQDALAEAPPITDLIALYDLPEAAELLLQAALPAPPPDSALAPPPAEKLDGTTLLQLEAALAQADLARFARRRTVWDIDRGAPAWEKRYLSTRDLAADLAPGHDIEADPWLFRRLTRTLDRRMLALLSAPGELAGAGPFGLNLNVASILSPEFLRFDDALPAGLRGHVVLDLVAADILADPAAFDFARGFARARAYRLLLRGVTPALADVVSLDALGMDLLQLRWSPALPGDGVAVLSAGPARFVLNRAAEPAALAWARAVGIRWVQGAAADGHGRSMRASPLGEHAAAA